MKVASKAGSAASGAALMLQEWHANRLVAQQQREVKRLKLWIWIYFWLLIFEGALRKWFLPSLSGPLLLIRDPVALIIYYRAYKCGKISMKKVWPFAVLTVALGLLACAQVASGVVSIPIAAFGLRSYVLHPYLIFVMAETLGEGDLYKFGRWIFLLSIPMFFLVLMQYRSPASAVVNAGAGENAQQILSAGGHVRPAATFSYGIGMQVFEILLAAFLLDALMRKGTHPRWLVYSALFAALGMVPLLGSRTVIFLLALLAIFMALSGVTHGARLVSLSKITLLLLLVGLVVLQFSFFQSGLDTLQQRWEEASRAEGGDIEAVLSKRVLGVFEAGEQAATVVPWLGNGIGIGSSFAAATLGTGSEFLAGENEWERVVFEFGPIWGLLFMGVRVAFGIYLVLQAMQSLRGNAVLAWLLVPAVVPLIIMTIMEQATFLGFMVFVSGLCLAASRNQGQKLRAAVRKI